jgi:hypothetical protein
MSSKSILNIPFREGTIDLTMDSPDALFVQMKQKFGLSCHLIRTNSRPRESSEATQQKPIVPDIWTPMMQEMLPLLRSNIASSPSSTTAAATSPADGELPIFTENQAKKQKIAEFPTEDQRKEEYGAYMDENDMKDMDVFLKEFVVQSLLPTMERSVQHWNEQVASARRGLTSRLFSAGRRYFGNTTKTPGSAIATTSDSQAV